MSGLRVTKRRGCIMIRCVCLGCSGVVEAHDDAAGTVVICGRCGYVVQVPEPAQAGRTAQGPAPAAPKAAKPASDVSADRRAQYVLGGMYGLFVVSLPFALAHSKDGSPTCLILFALNVLLATAAGFLLLVGMHTPDYLTDWLRVPFTRLRALLLLLPMAVLGFAVAIHIYSP